MNPVLREKAIALRLRGRSYNEIRKILNIPSKGTLSYWFKGLQLPAEAKKRLAAKIKLANERGLLSFNRRRTKMIRTENRQTYIEAIKEIKTLSRNELLLVGTILYWGEGTKSFGKQNISGIALSNSDPNIISCFMKFIRKILGVKDEKIRAGVQIHPNINVGKAKSFWAKGTSLPRDRFYITEQVSRAGQFKRTKRFLPFGTCTIKVNNRLLFYKIKGYIDGVADKLNQQS